MRRTLQAVPIPVLVGLVAMTVAGGCSTDPEPTGAPTPAASVPAASTPAASTPASSPSREPGPTGVSPSPTRESTVPTDLSPQEQDDLNRRLIDASWRNDVAAARRLIRSGANVNAQDETEQSAFLIAASEGYLGLLELALRNDGDVRSLDRFDGTALIRAAERGHHDIVGRLLQTRIRLDHVNNLGWTALHEAIILGDGSQRYVDTVRLLVAGGADVRVRSERDGAAPLEHAEAAGHDALVTILRQTLDTARLERPDERLLRAANTGDADQVALALRAGARLETRDADRRTPLLLAVTADNLAVARLLVALGADPDALDAQHDTPWLVTGVTGSVEMLEVLLPARPDLTIRNRYGGISVIPASERGHVDYVRRVVRTKTNVNHVNDLGWTAMLEAVILGDGSTRYQQIVRILLAAGADPGIADNNGVTALEHAQSKGQDAVAAILARG